MLPSSTLAHANSFSITDSHLKKNTKAHLAKSNAGAKSPSTPPLTLPPPILARSLRNCSVSRQSHLPQRHAWPCTSIAIVSGSAKPKPTLHNMAVPQEDDGIERRDCYDLLLMGAHSYSQVNGRSCLYVSILPHVNSVSAPASAESEEKKNDEQFSLFKGEHNSAVGRKPNFAPPPVRTNVRVIPSYGEYNGAAAASSSSSSGPSSFLNSIWKRGSSTAVSASTGRRSKSCNSWWNRLSRGLMNPVSSIRSIFQAGSGSFANGSPALPPVRHYPKIASLEEHGMELVESNWLWKDSPFYALELVWEEADADWIARETQAKKASFAEVSSNPAHSHRDLPIHPSHLCVEPATGEILITDHDRHAVYSMIPCWVMHQKLLQLSLLPQERDEVAPKHLPDEDDFTLPLPDVLLDLVVGYLGNQVRLLAGESNIKGCKDGSGTDAHFNAPNGVTVHPKTGQIFISDGHWNSRIACLQPNTAQISITPGTASAASTSVVPVTSSSSSSSIPVSESVSSSLVSNSPPYPPRWNVASIPLHPQGQHAKSTWFSAVNHNGVYATAGPALWPMRFPTSPIVLPAGTSSSDVEEAGSDALVLLDEELHIMRYIPLSSGCISTVSGQMGQQGNAEGWASDAQFLFPQSLISIPHPLSSPRLFSPFYPSASSPPINEAFLPRNLCMKDRQAILVADTGNDRLCLVNLISRAEIRQEKRKQSMLRRQMRALAAQNNPELSSVSLSFGSSSDSNSDGDSDDDADFDPIHDVNGPVVGHVETVKVRSLISPPELAANFIQTPWTPWSAMPSKNKDATSEEEALPIVHPELKYSRSNGPSYGSVSVSSTSSSSSSSATASTAIEPSASSSEPSASTSSSVSSASSADPSGPVPARAAIPLTPLPFVHRGQNTFIRKLCMTSQGKIIALSRIGLQLLEWHRDARDDIV